MPARPAKPAKKATAAATAEPADQERFIDGLRVIKDEPETSPLSRRAGFPQIIFKGRRVLTLEDGSQLIGCADCEFTGTRGQVIKHRIDDHGAAKASRTKDSSGGISDNVLRMTLGEVLRHAGQLDVVEEYIDAQAVERDEAVTRADAAERRLRQIQRALDKAGFVIKPDEGE